MVRCGVSGCQACPKGAFLARCGWEAPMSTDSEDSEDNDRIRSLNLMSRGALGNTQQGNDEVVNDKYITAPTNDRLESARHDFSCQ